MQNSHLVGLFLLFGVVSSTATAQVTLDQAEAQNRFIEAGQVIPRVIGGEFTVVGTRVYNASILAAKRIVFKPGAQLVFSDAAIRDRRNLFIFAEEMISEDAERPGVITWQKQTAQAGSPQGAGPAGPDHGGREGTRGGDGVVGPNGTPGADGQAAPDLTVVAKNFRTIVRADFSGSQGGAGGVGGNGGRGGGGGYGNPASQDLFNCRRGGGNGAPGGNGGSGGQGGHGGAGGRGGNITLIVPATVVPTATRFLSVDVTGGKGGNAGAPGEGGAGGPGGAGGTEAKPHCGGGSPGPGGGGGSRGAAGTPGNVGNSGSFFVGGLQPADLDRLFR